MTLQQSVPSPSAVQATFAATLFDEWIRLGLRDVVVCPGSRSTPLALACAKRPELNLHVRIDERSAGFFALGRALATSSPVVIVVTSGTAAAELHACVAEADQAFVPLIVVTADRPPELHGVGAPQTIDQFELYGPMVRRFEDWGVAQLVDAPRWRGLAQDVWGSALGVRGAAGPAHLNAPFTEPLIGDSLDLPDVEGVTLERVTPASVDTDFIDTRVLCVAGRGVDPSLIEHLVSKNWVVIGDVTIRGAISYADPLIRSDLFAELARPDVVVRLGGLVASKVLQERLRSWGARIVAFDGAGFVADPDRIVETTFSGLPAPLAPANDVYSRLWRESAERVNTLIDGLESETGPLVEPTVARTMVVESARHNVPLVVGSSMPVRDVEWWAPPRCTPTYSNRGVNGIDGVVSTAFGVAAGSKGLGLVGDITLLHDISGLVDGLGTAEGSCVLVVVDNDGGGIFSFLSQSTLVEPSRFEQLFGTPRHHDIVAIARSLGHAGVRVATRGQLRVAIEEGLARTGVTVVVAKVADRTHNVQLHESWNQMVTELTESFA